MSGLVEDAPGLTFSRISESDVAATVLALLGLILMADIAFRIYAVRIALPIFETPPPFHVERYPADPHAEMMRIPVAPDRTLAAALFFPEVAPDGVGARGVVVFCPELGSDRWSAPSYCRGLLDLGYLVLAFDFRGQGDSDAGPTGHEPHHWVTEVEVTDVLAALERATRDERLSKLPLTLFGVSRGAGAALDAASRLERGRVRCVIADGAYSPRTMMLFFFHRWAGVYVPDWLPKLLPRWHVASTLRIVEWLGARRRPTPFVHVETSLRRLRRTPVLMISGEKDTYVLPRFTIRLQRYTRQPKDRAWIVGGAKHNGSRRIDPAEYDRRILEFIEAAAPIAGAASAAEPAVPPTPGADHSGAGRASARALGIAMDDVHPAVVRATEGETVLDPQTTSRVSRAG